MYSSDLQSKLEQMSCEMGKAVNERIAMDSKNKLYIFLASIFGFIIVFAISAITLVAILKMETSVATCSNTSCKTERAEGVVQVFSKAKYLSTRTDEKGFVHTSKYTKDGNTIYYITKVRK
jgi:hypothetical protein